MGTPEIYDQVMDWDITNSQSFQERIWEARQILTEYDKNYHVKLDKWNFLMGIPLVYHCSTNV